MSVFSLPEACLRPPAQPLGSLRRLCPLLHRATEGPLRLLPSFPSPHHPSLPDSASPQTWACPLSRVTPVLIAPLSSDLTDSRGPRSAAPQVTVCGGSRPWAGKLDRLMGFIAKPVYPEHGQLLPPEASCPLQLSLQSIFGEPRQVIIYRTKASGGPLSCIRTTSGSDCIDVFVFRSSCKIMKSHFYGKLL